MLLRWVTFLVVLGTLLPLKLVLAHIRSMASFRVWLHLLYPGKFFIALLNVRSPSDTLKMVFRTASLPMEHILILSALPYLMDP